MRVVIQRVKRAKVEANGEPAGEIGEGLVVFLGIEERDEKEDMDWLTQKIANMRVFNDEEGKMNYSVKDVSGQCMVVSQFTLHASTKKGNRPSFMRAADPDQAEPLYESFIKYLSVLTGNDVESGKFGADMQVELVNDGPVTITMDSRDKE